ncbi:MAG: hypothetical protein ACRDM9_14660, partial [Gaiellaceae bacterium]
MTAGILEAVDRVLNRGGDADDVLRQVLAILHERGGAAWAGIAFVEEDELQLGPTVGGPPPAEPERRAIEFGGARVAELRTTPGADAALLDRLAVVISPYCLVGWDTGG